MKQSRHSTFFALTLVLGACGPDIAGMDDASLPDAPVLDASMGSDGGAGDTASADSDAGDSDAGAPADGGARTDATSGVDGGPSGADAGTDSGGADAGAPGFPNLGNTGVPPGTSLRECPSDIREPGVYDGCHFSGVVTIHTDNVTIRRSKIDGIVRSDVARLPNTLLEDIEIDAQNNLQFDAIHLRNFTCRRCQVHDARVCFAGTGITIEDSYCFDLYGEGDPAGSGSHNEAVISSGTDPIVIRNNNLVTNWNAATSGGGMSAVIAIYANDGHWGPLGNVLIEGNRIENTGGAFYCMYTGQTHRGPTGFTVRDNVFVQGDAVYGRGCGSPTYPDWVRSSENMWSGNTTEDGTAIDEPPSN